MSTTDPTARAQSTPAPAVLEAYRYAQSMAVTERARGRQDEERAWLDLLHLLDRDEATPTPAPVAVPEGVDPTVYAEVDYEVWERHRNTLAFDFPGDGGRYFVRHADLAPREDAPRPEPEAEPDWLTRLPDQWEDEADKHARDAEYGIAEGLRVAADELTRAIRENARPEPEAGDAETRLARVKAYVDDPGNWSSLDGRRTTLLALIDGKELSHD